jgi:hypothetical protein
MAADFKSHAPIRVLVVGFFCLPTLAFVGSYMLATMTSVHLGGTSSGRTFQGITITAAMLSPLTTAIAVVVAAVAWESTNWQSRVVMFILCAGSILGCLMFWLPMLSFSD